MIFAVAASVLIVVALATWVAIRRHDSGLVARSEVVDLRNRSVVRGMEPPPNETPIKISHRVSHLDIYLPLGSNDGPYELHIATRNQELVFTGEAEAKVQQGITSLSVDINVSSARPGLYTLQLQRVGSEWISYPLRIE
jgi:hypothetical protein